MPKPRVLLSLEEYLAEVLALVKPVESVEELTLGTALGRVLAEPVVSRTAVPPFPNSAMDGFALRHADLAEGAVLRVVGEVAAGSAADPTIGRGECVRIMTGAPVPTDADTVVPVELTDGGRESVRFTGVVDEGAHIRPVGDDVASGAAVLTVGTRLGARQLSLAAAVGAETMTCIRKPVIGIAATGDELVNPGRELARGQIYESNATYLTAAARRDGAEPYPLGSIRDQADALKAALNHLAAESDLVVISGGVSVGDHDVSRITLEQVGGTFRHVRMQTGKPQGWALWGEKDVEVPVIALPGNPLSASVSWELFVTPMIATMLRLEPPAWVPAVAGEAWRSPAGREQVLPVVVEVDESGRQVVRPSHRKGSASHMVTSLSRADALARVPEDVTEVAPGDPVLIRRFP